MNRLEQARQLVRAATLPEPLRRIGENDIGSFADEEARALYHDSGGTWFVTGELTPDVLAESLHYVVRVATRAVADESAVPLGASKHRGLPHLPPGLAWPTGMYFLAQFNLAELHPFDVYGVFPDSGIMYVFVDSESGVRVMHHDGPLDALRVTPYPDPATIPNAEYYLDDFVNGAGLVHFVPQAHFYVSDGDAYDLSKITKLVPAELRDQVAAVLRAPVVARDSTRRIFGHPIYWQGEDEGHESDEVEHLLFQDEIDDATLHVWISDEDARARDYGGCWMDSSGT